MSKIILYEQESPVSPPTNGVSIYPKAGGGLWKTDDTGIELQLKEAGTAPAAHSASHTDSTDDIQSATNAQKGLATAAHIAAIEANTEKETNIAHPLVETPVPVGAVFTDTETSHADVLVDGDIGTTVQAHSATLDNTTAPFVAAQETKLGYISVTQAVDLDVMESDIAALDQAVILKGGWDASAGTFPDAAQAGWAYIVSVGGTIDGKVFVANDRIVAILDNASTTVYASNWHLLDYTDQVLSVAGRTGAVTVGASDIADFDTEVENNSAVTLNTAKVSNVEHPSDTLVPQNITDIGNLSGTNTGDQDLSGKADKATTYTETEVDNLLNAVWTEITQAAYDALSPPDASTLYVIVG